ncbi:hypothetical protein MOQ_003044 [Trypanosoma cruzi marinkellei]|uniref:Uncharacterized protein n=1 Tax=Trypanosoma cruzi marinkellei TaxID=85056 RepID=K2NW43_TRYCR|nr:hypothetical protein MOQ_003044 [Trypanosoma cruzi marinkellei]
MGTRARDQNCEISASVSPLEGAIGISSEFVETESQNGGLPRKEMDLQRRTQKLRDEGAVSSFTTPEEGNLATAEKCKQRHKQANSNGPQGRQRPGPGSRSTGVDGAGVGGSTDNVSGDAATSDRKVNRPARKGSDAATQPLSISHARAFSGARVDCKQKDVIAADGGGGGGGVEEGENGRNQPNSFFLANRSLIVYLMTRLKRTRVSKKKMGCWARSSCKLFSRRAYVGWVGSCRQRPRAVPDGRRCKQLRIVSSDH